MVKCFTTSLLTMSIVAEQTMNMRHATTVIVSRFDLIFSQNAGVFESPTFSSTEPSFFSGPTGAIFAEVRLSQRWVAFPHLGTQ